MGRQIEQLAEFVARTRWEDIPEAVQRHAKMTLLDTLGVMLAGAERRPKFPRGSAARRTAGRPVTRAAGPLRIRAPRRC